MPIYEYACNDCPETFELLVRGDEQPSCPKCESSRLEKQLSVPASLGSQTGSDLPMAGDCGRPQCGSGCMGLDG
ncbi:MAG: zinc ribbon domain-containing protein [Planctomycetaceae bacterium]|nr:zinc ribbon domain-containing protein [Planctomycetaceae bacterium]